MSNQMLSYFDFPESFAAGSRRGGCPSRGAEEDVLLFAVLVHCEELLLLSVEETDDIAAFQHIVKILFMLHEERYLPWCS